MTVSLTLPTDGQDPWGDTLNACLTTLQNAVNALPAATGAGDLDGAKGTITVLPTFAHAALVTLDTAGAVSKLGTHVALSAVNSQNFTLTGTGVYTIGVSAEITAGVDVDGTTALTGVQTAALLKGLWLQPNSVTGGYMEIGSQSSIFNLAFDQKTTNFSHGNLTIRTVDDPVVINFNIGVEGAVHSATLSVEIDIVKIA